MSARRLLPLLMLLAGACATHLETQEKSDQAANAPEVLQAPVERDEDVIVEQDLAGHVEQDDKTAQTELSKLEKELDNESRVPAQDQEFQGTAEVIETPVAAVAVDQANETAQEVAQTEVEQTEPAPLSQEELTKRLFDAEAISVRPGQTLATIARDHLGSAAKWREIASLNPNLRNPNQLQVGEKLFIPKVEIMDTREPASVIQDTSKVVPLLNAGEAKKDETVRGLASEPVPVIAEAESVPSTTETITKEDVPANERKIAGSTPRSVSRIIGILGLLLCLGVVLSFVFSKPQKR